MQSPEGLENTLCPICRHTFHVLAVGGPDCYLSDVESGENLA